MEQSTSKAYDSTSKKDILRYRSIKEKVEIPFTVTVTPGGLFSGVAATPETPALTTPWEDLAITANRLLGLFGDQFTGWLVIQAHLSTYQALLAVEHAKGFQGSPQAEGYYNYCVKPAVERMCPKPCD